MRLMRLGRHVILGLTLPALASAAGGDHRVADAIRDRDYLAVTTLISERADVNGRQPDGTTALHWAVHFDDRATTDVLIAAGADVNAATELGATPLALACAHGSTGIAEALLRAGARPDERPSSGETPLMAAARTGDVALVRVLVDHGADVAARETAQGQTALMWAAAEKHPRVVGLLLERGADPRTRAKSGFSALLFAARAGDRASAARLLEAGANVNDPAADGSSPLLVATVRGHTSFARWLLERGADPNVAGTGYTPLHWAAGSWETELSGPRGIRIDRDEEWQGIRGLAAERADFVRALLDGGADPNVAITKAPPRVGFTVFRPGALIGATPFWLAAMAGDVDVMRALVEYGADARRPNQDGTTPLMAAAGVGRVLAETRLSPDATLPAVRLARELGADVNAANATGDTALHGAAHIRSDAIVRFLAEHGARLDVTNARGETPLAIAERTVAAGSAPVFVRTSTGDLLRALGAKDTATGSPDQRR